ncbi:MAG: hypothetical protein FD153_1189 [Rhodospirillaceae bacterium]|nr:MAG: hypothetical protein FD153_1189 [Rhodospirillaceae bacterium]
MLCILMENGEVGFWFTLQLLGHIYRKLFSTYRKVAWSATTVMRLDSIHLSLWFYARINSTVWNVNNRVVYTLY